MVDIPRRLQYRCVCPAEGDKTLSRFCRFNQEDTPADWIVNLEQLKWIRQKVVGEFRLPYINQYHGPGYQKQSNPGRLNWYLSPGSFYLLNFVMLQPVFWWEKVYWLQEVIQFRYYFSNLLLISIVYCLKNTIWH